MTWPAIPWSQAPPVTSSALRQADAAASTQFGIEPLQLMEVAGEQVARFVNTFFDGIGGKRVLVVAGSGNNGGDALVAARFLHQRGAIVSVSLVSSRDPKSLSAHHARAIEQLGIPVADAPAGVDASPDVIVDGLLGTGIRPPLREPAPAIIGAMNAAGQPIVAIDVPSGMDADSGAGANDAVRAVATVTLAAPKAGLMVAPNAGRVFLADIGMPARLFSTAETAISAIFRIADLVELIRPVS
ncbi:MAG TPA: NAD(P)H-hydrate epimerase [Candidatus Dormibacteraeota bacterium]|nr:NAD(P)H-hydrate epimerase [Candidatus Dormibacteraeota bacterium]